MNVKWQYGVDGLTLNELMEQAALALELFVAPMPLPVLWLDSITLDIDTVEIARNANGETFTVAYEATARTSFDTEKRSDRR